MTSATESITCNRQNVHPELEDDITLMKKQYRSDLKQQAHAIENLMSTVEVRAVEIAENQNRIAINTYKSAKAEQRT